MDVYLQEMRKRTYALIVATTAIATTVSAINNFVRPSFGLREEVVVFFGMVALFIMMRSMRRSNIYNNLKSSIVFRFIALSVGLVFGWSATINLSYSIQIFAMPLRDDIFLAADRLLGFDYAALMDWVAQHPRVATDLGFVYSIFPILIISLTLIDVVLSDDIKIGEYFFTSALTAFLIAFGICALLPAAGAASLLDPHTAAFATGATPLERLYALRSGDVHQFNRGEAGAMVSFPSMHVAIAVLALHATQGVRWLFLCVLPISLGFCVTALTHGGHYLVDCFAGAAVAVIAIKINSVFHGFVVPNFSINTILNRKFINNASQAV